MRLAPRWLHQNAGFARKLKGFGVYLNSVCTQPGAAGGPNKEFVWLPQATGTPSAYKAKGFEAKLYTFDPGVEELPTVECTSSLTKGKEGRTESTAIVKFKGCEESGEKCVGGHDAIAGEIITFELKGKLGVIDAATEEVGEDFVSNGPGGIFASFRCADDIETKGSVIASVTQVNAKASTKSIRTFTVVGSKQEPENLEGEPKDTLFTEVDSLAGGIFPFTSVEETVLEVTGKSAETRF